MIVETLITGRVPSTGMKFAWIRRRMPDARPGIAASQKSSVVVNLNPIAGIRTTTALITNHVANEKISENVVTPHVRHASALPVSCQNFGSSGFQFWILAMTPCLFPRGNCSLSSLDVRDCGQAAASA